MEMMVASEPMRTGMVAVSPVPKPSDEANHRVANQLQLIAALIAGEARAIADPVTLAILEPTRNRIVAIGAVHRQLYAQADDRPDLGDYLDQLGVQLAGSCGPGRWIEVDADRVRVTGDVATAVGILGRTRCNWACRCTWRR